MGFESLEDVSFFFCDSVIYILLGLLVGFLHRVLKNKFARINLWLFVWLGFSYWGYSLKDVFCMCGYPLGFHHAFQNDFWFPIVYLFIAANYAILSFKTCILFWLTSIFFAQKIQEGESLKQLWLRRIFNFLKVCALVYLLSFIVNFFATNYEPYWAYPKVLFVGLVASFIALSLANLKMNKICWLILILLISCTLYYAKTIPLKRDNCIVIKGIYTLPKLVFYYSEENDARDYYSRKIEETPRLKYCYHEFAGGWNLSKLRELKNDKYFFCSSTENAEIFEKIYDKLTMALPIIDDSQTTKNLLAFLADKQKLTFLSSYRNFRLENELMLTIYIFKDASNGVYGLDLNLKLRGK